MNQPQNPVPPRGARPQLFSPPASTTANAKRHADFGPSILATIDGGHARFAASRGRSRAKRLLLIGALVLMAAAAYLGVKFSGSRATPASELVVVAAPVMKAVEVAPPASQALVAQGAAAIETVPPVAAPASAAAASQPSNVAASLNNIQLALDRAEPVPSRKEATATKDNPPVRRVPQPAVSATKPPTKPALDDDADLLAAMLPHLKRSPTPTSPAYEKRCGQLAGDAAAECRAKFCGGKQGVDAACPPAVKPAQK